MHSKLLILFCIRRYLPGVSHDRIPGSCSAIAWRCIFVITYLLSQLLSIMRTVMRTKSGCQVSTANLSSQGSGSPFKRLAPVSEVYTGGCRKKQHRISPLLSHGAASYLLASTVVTYSPVNWPFQLRLRRIRTI